MCAELASNNPRSELVDAVIGPAFINPGSPSQNGIVEIFNGKLRDELIK